MTTVLNIVYKNFHFSDSIAKLRKPWNRYNRHYVVSISQPNPLKTLLPSFTALRASLG